MGNKLYVGNLPYSVRDQDLEQAFSQFGAVTSAKVMMERDTGRSKGFGFVEMGSDEEAQAAINGMNGQPLGGRNVVVNEARPMEARPPRSGGAEAHQYNGLTDGAEICSGTTALRHPDLRLDKQQRRLGRVAKRAQGWDAVACNQPRQPHPCARSVRKRTGVWAGEKIPCSSCWRQRWDRPGPRIWCT